MLIVVINGVREYFDRQQSRWTFPRNTVFHRGAQEWGDYLYKCTENADGVLARRSGINKAAVFLVPHTFAIPAGLQQAESCSPTFSRLERGARQEALWMFSVRQPAAGPDGSSPAPGATALPSSLPAAWMLMLGSHGKRNRVLVFASTDILRNAHAFLGDVLFLVRKLETLKMSVPNFCSTIGVSFFLSFSFPWGVRE